MNSLRKFVGAIPILGLVAKRLYHKVKGSNLPFVSSTHYWEQRYKSGGNSGNGSYGILAEYKAKFLNQFVRKNTIETVIEFGCGDGNQLNLSDYPSYLGLDVSSTSIRTCRQRFGDVANRKFAEVKDFEGAKADLTISLDVIYHLVEDDVYENYMELLFDSSHRYVIIYSSNFESGLEREDAHVRHRKFTEWVSRQRPQWQLSGSFENPHPFTGDNRTGSFADFHLFELSNQE